MRASLFATDQDREGKVLGEAIYEGRQRSIDDWLAEDAKLLREEVGWGVDALAAALAAQLRER